MIHLKVIQAKSHIITSTVMQHVTQHDFIVNSWRWRKTTQPSCTQNLIPDLLTLTWAFADVPTRLHAKHTHTSGLLQRNNTYSVISYTLTVKISSSVNHVKSMKPLTLCMYISIYIYICIPMLRYDCQILITIWHDWLCQHCLRSQIHETHENIPKISHNHGFFVQNHPKNEQKRSYWRYTHFVHDYGRKGSGRHSYTVRFYESLTPTTQLWQEQMEWSFKSHSRWWFKTSRGFFGQ